MDIFFEETIDVKDMVCHSGGAMGSDTEFENMSTKYGIKTKAYSYKTPMHKSDNKVEISDDDYKEGIVEVNKANKWLNRFGIHKYMNLLARNWAQVKYSQQIFAVGVIIKPGEKNNKGYYNKGKYDVINGGTGYAIQMGINHNREIYVFDQNKDSWFKWSYTTMSFLKIDYIPKITCKNFAGIGTREINDNGKKAISDIYEETFKEIIK